MKVFNLGEFHGDVVHQQMVDGIVFAMTTRRKGATVGPHTHSHASLVTLVKGEHHFINSSGKISYSLPGSWYYGEPHSVHTHDACQSDITSIGIQFNLEQFPNPKIPDTAWLRGSAAQFSLELIMEHLTQPRATTPEVLSATFALIRALIADEHERPDSTVPAWLKDLKKHLDSQFLQPIPIETLAKKVGIHPSHMARTFREYFGLTVTHYLRDRRLEWSLDAIKNTDEKLGQIALLAGFADQAHFSREFKRRYGHNPSVYR